MEYCSRCIGRSDRLFRHFEQRKLRGTPLPCKRDLKASVVVLTCAQVQAGSDKTLHVKAVFHTSLGVYIGHALDVPGAGVVEELPLIWQTAATNFTTRDDIAILYSNVPLLSEFAALKQTDVPFKSGELHTELSADSLKQVSKAAAPLLCFMHRLRNTTAIKKEQARFQFYKTNFPDATCSPQDNPLPSVYEHNTLLRSALLVTKAATLAREFRSVPTEGYCGKRTLWSTAGRISQHIQGLCLSAGSSSMHQPVTAAEVSEAQHISLLLVQILLPALRQSLASGDLHASSVCCGLLTALMAKYGDCFVARQVTDAVMKQGEYSKLVLNV